MLATVIDRFEGNKAVLLIGSSDNKVILPRQYLPNGVKEGDCLQLLIEYDAAATQSAKQVAADLLAAVKNQN